MHVPAMRNFEVLFDYFIVVGKYTQSNRVKCTQKYNTSIAQVLRYNPWQNLWLSEHEESKLESNNVEMNQKER